MHEFLSPSAAMSLELRWGGSCASELIYLAERKMGTIQGKYLQQYRSTLRDVYGIREAFSEHPREDEEDRSS
jgi:hypothetical protein